MKSFYEIAGVLPLTVDNSLIEEENGFPILYKIENGEKKRIGAVETKRAFPFEKTDEFIILEGEDGNDLGFIRRLDARSEAERDILHRALSKRYFMPKITKILSVKDRFGFSYFKVETESGSAEFSVRDPYKSIIMIGRSMILTDADGSRYLIESVDALPKKEKKKIEQYLW